MELQQFPQWWEKLLYCPRYKIKGHQTVRRRQRARDQGTRLEIRRRYKFRVSLWLEIPWRFFVFLTATLFFWSKFTCDTMSYWQCPRFAVNLSPPIRVGEVAVYLRQNVTATLRASRWCFHVKRSAILWPRQNALRQIVAPPFGGFCDRDASLREK